MGARARRVRGSGSRRGCCVALAVRARARRRENADFSRRPQKKPKQEPRPLPPPGCPTPAARPRSPFQPPSRLQDVDLGGLQERRGRVAQAQGRPQPQEVRLPALLPAGLWPLRGTPSGLPGISDPPALRLPPAPSGRRSQSPPPSPRTRRPARLPRARARAAAAGARLTPRSASRRSSASACVPPSRPPTVLLLSPCRGRATWKDPRADARLLAIHSRTPDGRADRKDGWPDAQGPRRQLQREARGPVRVRPSLVPFPAPRPALLSRRRTDADCRRSHLFARLLAGTTTSPASVPDNTRPPRLPPTLTPVVVLPLYPPLPPSSACVSRQPRPLRAVVEQLLADWALGCALGENSERRVAVQRERATEQKAVIQPTP